MPEIKIGSSLNFSNVDELLKDTAVSQASESVVLDLTATSHVDSAGVALILHWLRLCQKKGNDLTLQGVSKPLQTLLEAYELENVLSR